MSGGMRELHGPRGSRETAEGDVGSAQTLGAGGAAQAGQGGRAPAWKGALEFEARQEGRWWRAGRPREGSG